MIKIMFQLILKQHLQTFYLTHLLIPNIWQEGDLVWLDDDYTGKWGVYRYTANVQIISTSQYVETKHLH